MSQFEIGIDIESGDTIIKINSKFYRPTEVDLLLGDSSKAKKILSWQNKTSFKELVSMMVVSDYDKIKKSL